MLGVFEKKDDSRSADAPTPICRRICRYVVASHNEPSTDPASVEARLISCRQVRIRVALHCVGGGATD